jgi:hypothetical protein
MNTDEMEKWLRWARDDGVPRDAPLLPLDVDQRSEPFALEMVRRGLAVERSPFIYLTHRGVEAVLGSLYAHRLDVRAAFEQRVARR